MCKAQPHTLEEMIALLECARGDYSKFYYDGNMAAAVRIRNAMQEIKAAAQEVRVHIQGTKNGYF
jgi:hypothetical protein